MWLSSLAFLNILVAFYFSTNIFVLFQVVGRKWAEGIIHLSIIPDIFDPVPQPDPTLMNRAFWRQIIWSLSLELLHPFLFSIRFFDPDQPFLLCI